MEANEVIDELEQAVQAVQASAQAFENTCSGTEELVLALKTSYIEKADALLDQVTEMDTEKSSLIVEIVENGIQTTEETEEVVTDISNEYIDEIKEKISGGVAALTENFEGAKEVTSGFVEQTANEIEAVSNEYSVVDGSYRESLNESIAKLGEIENMVMQELDNFSTTLSTKLSVDHQDTLNQYRAFVDTSVNSDLENEFMQQTGDFDDFSAQLTSNFENMSDQLSSKFEEFTSDLVDYTEVKATEEVKENVNSLIDRIVGELASTVSESIVKSTVGVSVTGATSPFLPVLVAFNAIFNALEFAIELWKDFKRGLGF